MTPTGNKRPVPVRSSPPTVISGGPAPDARGLSRRNARVTPGDSDPSDDQAAAELRDLDRPIELAGPRLPANYADRSPAAGKPVKAMLTEPGISEPDSESKQAGSTAWKCWPVGQSYPFWVHGCALEWLI
jgi:hypothetical protein